MISVRYLTSGKPTVLLTEAVHLSHLRRSRSCEVITSLLTSLQSLTANSPRVRVLKQCLQSSSRSSLFPNFLCNVLESPVPMEDSLLDQKRPFRVIFVIRSLRGSCPHFPQSLFCHLGQKSWERPRCERVGLHRRRFWT